MTLMAGDPDGPTHYQSADTRTACGMSLVNRAKWLTTYRYLVTCPDCLSVLDQAQPSEEKEQRS